MYKYFMVRMRGAHGLDSWVYVVGVEGEGSSEVPCG